MPAIYPVSKREDHPFYGAADYSEIMVSVRKDPVLIRARESIECYEKSRDDAVRKLALPRQERLVQSGALAKTYLKEEIEGTKNTLLPTAVERYIGVGTVAIGGALLTGVAGPLGVMVLGTGLLVSAFHPRGFPRLVSKVAGNWLIPGNVDKKLRSHYESLRRESEKELRKAREAYSQMEPKIVQKYVEMQKEKKARKASVVDLEEGPDYLMIDRVRLEKRAPGQAGAHHSPVK